jgi:UDP-N-acetylglucosamine 2-epimerase (non-hydrolysing)
MLLKRRESWKAMITLEDRPPDLVIVVGDVNSTLACALTAKKRNLAVAHLEAGLRSGDRSMPEEINRIATDAISDYLWTHSPDADENLLREGQPPSLIRRVGNIMVDAYELMAEKIQQADVSGRYGLPNKYIVATLHRPSNVDLPENLPRLIAQLQRCAEEMPVVFPVHPRTRQRLEAEGLWSDLAGTRILAIEPLGYVEFMSLVSSCSLVLTDSGGLQEETSYLGIRCVTVRPSTERPITLTLGTNILSPIDAIADVVHKRLSEPERPRPTIPLWDGRTSRRIVQALQRDLNS